MIDYLKIWIEDTTQIDLVKKLPFLSFKQEHDTDTGELIKGSLRAEWKSFKLRFLSDTRLEIAGSLHKFWHGGNEGDFTYPEIVSSIDEVCNALQLNPNTAQIKNLECGFNICPNLPASEIIEEILVYKNTRPNRPYEGMNEGFFFIEFAKSERYFKVYDKGRQYKTANTLRVEAKFMRSRELVNFGVNHLSDLKSKKTLSLLGKKTLQETKNLVFNDSTINTQELNLKDRELYKRLCNPNEWVHRKGKSCTGYRNEKRFVELVNHYGTKKHSNTISDLIEGKLTQLLQTPSCTVFLSNYTLKSLQIPYCQTSGGKLQREKTKEGKFYSSRIVVDKKAHQSRHNNNCPRNKFRNKINKLKSKMVTVKAIPCYVHN